MARYTQLSQLIKLKTAVANFTLVIPPPMCMHAACAEVCSHCKQVCAGIDSRMAKTSFAATHCCVLYEV